MLAGLRQEQCFVILELSRADGATGKERFHPVVFFLRQFEFLIHDGLLAFHVLDLAEFALQLRAEQPGSFCDMVIAPDGEQSGVGGEKIGKGILEFSQLGFGGKRFFDEGGIVDKHGGKLVELGTEAEKSFRIARAFDDCEHFPLLDHLFFLHLDRLQVSRLAGHHFHHRVTARHGQATGDHVRIADDGAEGEDQDNGRGQDGCA